MPGPDMRLVSTSQGIASNGVGMSDGKKSAETAAAAVLRVLSANPGDAGVNAAAEIIEMALHNAAREQEKRELQRVADLQACLLYTSPSPRD